ncbi:MAG: DMT family transporter [Lachnospiraceae bacterium]|nr:DMT family transporter [Lachnospiraceae bacterium]
MKNKNLLGTGLLLLTAIIWGTAFAFQREGMDHIEPVTFTASRMSLAAIVIGLISLAQKTPSDIKTSEEKKAYTKNTLIGGICCGAFLASASLFQQIGIVYTTAGKAGFITALYILLVPILSFFLLKKKNTWLVWCAVFVGLIGMFLLCMTDDLRLTHGDALVACCAVFFSGHILCCDHFTKIGNPIRISAIQFAVTALVSWIIAFITESPNIAQMQEAMVAIVYCGIVSGGIGYTLQMIALRYSDPTVASLLMSFESVFAVLAGSIMLNEHMSTKEIAGCVIMFVAIILVQIPVKGRNKEADNSGK